MNNITIRDDIVQKIVLIAAKYQKQPDALVNEILESYIDHQSIDPQQSGTAFLQSISGIFTSDTQDTSERVSEIVANFILKKHEQGSNQ